MVSSTCREEEGVSSASYSVFHTNFGPQQGQKLHFSIVYNYVKSSLCKLQPQHKPVLGANNMPLDVLGEEEITLQLGGITAQHRVFVCRGLAQEILVGIDFLRTQQMCAEL